MALPEQYVSPPTDRHAWSEPGIELVAPEVYRVPLPLPGDGLRAVNVYVIVDGDGLTLIDAGWAIAQARVDLEAALASIDRGLSDIKQFLITHLHRDHYTQGPLLRKEFGSKVRIGIGEQESLRVLTSESGRGGDPFLANLRRCGAAKLAADVIAFGNLDDDDRPGWEQPDEWLQSPSQIELNGRSLDAIATPGHTAGHLVFRDSDAGILFAGDHILPHITPSIGFETAMVRTSLGDFLASLRHVGGLEDTLLLPAHGPVTSSVHERIAELITHHDDRLAECLDAVRAGDTTAFAAAQRLGWTRRQTAFKDLDMFNQTLAVGETSAHLDLLAAQAQLVLTEGDDGVSRYTVATTAANPA